jgi:hypothetical protein
MLLLQWAVQPRPDHLSNQASPTRRLAQAVGCRKGAVVGLHTLRLPTCSNFYCTCCHAMHWKDVSPSRLPFCMSTHLRLETPPLLVSLYKVICSTMYTIQVCPEETLEMAY